jgi:hypothetical protein
MGNQSRDRIAGVVLLITLAVGTGKQKEDRRLRDLFATFVTKSNMRILDPSLLQYLFSASDLSL